MNVVFMNIILSISRHALYKSRHFCVSKMIFCTFKTFKSLLPTNMKCARLFWKRWNPKFREHFLYSKLLSQTGFRRYLHYSCLIRQKSSHKFLEHYIFQSILLANAYVIFPSFYKWVEDRGRVFKGLTFNP